ncbi:MAG TPA: SDR family NAD(P)-dependent oxidoreductase, partial [Phototrophicaceae bacterium]|nr:SDR family NAD(P)-dependent oxidoreductase [Phototrophicaceae bacterium]
MADQRIALVTGANRGIGFEICRQLAQRGMQVILTSRDTAKGQQAVQQLPGVVFHPLDVTSPASVEAVRVYVEETFGRLDVLVNNA